MIRIPKDSEIQIDSTLRQVLVEGNDKPFLCRLTQDTYKTVEGKWIILPNKIVMVRTVYRHQIDTDKGIYVGIFGERLNTEISETPFFNLDTLIYQTPKNIEKIINWTFEKHNNI